ncbi:hypothetical protein HYR99_35935 [Candidatus Poribacteria bacterium]|nr:hypothetical protein [Candidatus Poribacteria bacterium]
MMNIACRWNLVSCAEALLVWCLGSKILGASSVNGRRHRASKESLMLRSRQIWTIKNCESLLTDIEQLHITKIRFILPHPRYEWICRK